MNRGRVLVFSISRKSALQFRLYAACLLSLMVFCGTLSSVGAPEIQPPWIDFAISSFGITPFNPAVGDQVIFAAEVRIVNTNMVLLQWVDVQCSVDDHVMHKETVVVGELPSSVYTSVPWNATPGLHFVRWEVDPHFNYPESNPDNNVVTTRFGVVLSNVDPDFSFTISRNWKVVRPDESAELQVSLYARNSNRTVAMSADGLPSGLAYSFEPPQLNSNGSSALEIYCGPVPVGLYYLTLTASREATIHSVRFTLVVEPLIKKGSTISISIASFSVTLGDNVSIAGKIFPSQSVPITLRYTRPEGLTFSRNLMTNRSGAFVYNFTPDRLGQWIFSVAWPGDLAYLAAQSAPVTVQVQTPPPSSAEGLVKELPALIAIGAILIVIAEYVLFRKFGDRAVSGHRRRAIRSKSDAPLSNSGRGDLLHKPFCASTALYRNNTAA
jgi:hypothetical protein